MDLQSLKNYHYWIGLAPDVVLHDVIRVGGWKWVFPQGVPQWASRVRNYFNVSPQRLTRLDDKASEIWLRVAQQAMPRVECRLVRMVQQSTTFGDKASEMYLRNAQEATVGCPVSPPPDPGMGLMDRIGTRNALSGDVYLDEFQRIWYQMGPGAGIYHYGWNPIWPAAEAVGATMRGQNYSPVFKLVSPDRSGGSRECIIWNSFRSDIGDVNDTIDVSHRHVKDSVKQGSYNYAETVAEGLPAHNRFDVDTDPMEPGFLVEPDRFSHLSQRRFPGPGGLFWDKPG